MAYIQFLGAAGVVTGSKHLVNAGDMQVLVDCGLFQGKKEWRERNWTDLPVPSSDIDAVLLTHAHLDHCGWIPRLYKEGYKGNVYATPATIDLCGVVLPDSGHLQEEDAMFHNKKGTSKHAPALPLYTLDDANECLKHFVPVQWHTPTQLGRDFSFQFVPSAHILGAAMAEITLGPSMTGKRLVFTGDIGRVRDETVAPGTVVHHGPEQNIDTSILVMESTYGDRPHPETDPRPQLAQIISDTVKRGGSVIVPAFAVERTQKLLFMLKQLMEDGKVPRVPVHTDSPMAIKAVKIFLQYKEEFTPQTKALIDKYGSPLEWPGFFFDTSMDDSKKINSITTPMIIVSSSGMATGGRVLHHLMARVGDARNTVLFIGYQSPGTRGFTIKNGAPSVRIFNQDVAIRAKVESLEQFSDHADTGELISWMKTFPHPPDVTYLVHGDPGSASQMKAAFESALHWRIEVAQYMQQVQIEGVR